MSNHYVVITDINNTHNDTASIDVTTDPTVPVRVMVYTPLGPKPIDLTLNDNSFATSGDLFAVSGGNTALVGCATSILAIASKAALRQKKLVMSIPPSEQVLGVSFGFPLNDVGTDAYVLIGNPSGMTAVGGVSYGNPAAPFTTNIELPSNVVQTIAIPSTISASRVNINITNGVQVLVQILINGRGQEFTMTMVSPTN